MQDILMTLIGKEQIEKELNQLIKTEREEIKEQIAEARAHGDLKENAEYHAAKEKQSHIEGRIAVLQNCMAKAKVIDVSTLSTSKAVFGATVTLYDGEKESSKTYQIVGEEESDSSLGKISYSSPLGKAMIGKEDGDEVVVKAPKGDIHYEIESIEYK
jgi:transcription elongation factor GreA